MLNDTQKGLLDEFINDYFIKAVESFFQYSGTESRRIQRGKIRSVRDD